jgi:cytochrome bd-type quinol oxidase subunit 2
MSERLPPGTSDDGVSSRCLNCGAELVGDFCHGCGQNAGETQASLRRWIGKEMEEHLSLDAKLPRTLRSLFFKPGFLTREYLDGRRARYLRPLQLYLLAAALLFVGSWFKTAAEDGLSAAWRGPEQAAAGRSAAIQERSGDSPAAGQQSCAGEDRTVECLMKYAAGEVARAGSEYERSTQLAFIDLLSRAMFLLLPLFSFLLFLLYLRQRRHYLEHLIFALHLHAFAFIILGFLAMLPEAARLSDGTGSLFVPIMSIYLFLAMRAVYRQSRTKTTVKLALLVGGYVPAMIVAGAIGLLAGAG